jgi:hypothetical protein
VGVSVGKSIGAYAVRRSEPAQPLLADSEDTLNKVIALRWIGEWQPADDRAADQVRAALLEERWADAVVGWMNATGEEVDVFPFGIEVHEAPDYADEEFGPRVQTTPLFRST